MITLNEVIVLKNKVSFEEISENVDMIVDGAFDEDGKYHKYLLDYCYACSILRLFTDYSGDFDFNEVMDMYADSTAWGMMEEKCGNGPSQIVHYVNEDIDYLTQPMASVNMVAKSIQDLVKNVNKRVDAIDVKKVVEFIEKLDVDSINKFSALLGGRKN